MKKCMTLALVALALISSGCSGKKAAAAQAEPPKPALVLPITTNTTGKTLIQSVSGNASYPNNTYAITSIAGETVILDPSQMPPRSLVEFNPVLIASTHGHMDHTDSKYADSYDCKKISYFKADMRTRDFRVYSMLSAHSGATIDRSNVIMVVEVDGLRIAHLGDLGQTTFTKDQLKALGKIDIAIMQFVNPLSTMTIENEKGFKLMDELKPTVIIPTHYSDANLPAFESRYGKITDFDNSLAVSRADMPAKDRAMWRILNKHRYQ